jgi:hypothetical protein
MAGAVPCCSAVGCNNRLANGSFEAPAFPKIIRSRRGHIASGKEPAKKMKSAQYKKDLLAAESRLRRRTELLSHFGIIRKPPLGAKHHTGAWRLDTETLEGSQRYHFCADHWRGGLSSEGKTSLLLPYDPRQASQAAEGNAETELAKGIAEAAAAAKAAASASAAAAAELGAAGRAARADALALVKAREVATEEYPDLDPNDALAQWAVDATRLLLEHEATQVELQRRAAAAEAAAADKVQKLSYDALRPGGDYETHTREYTGVSPCGLHAIVEGTKLCHMEVTFINGLRDRDFNTHGKETTALGLPTCVCMTLTKLRLGAENNIIGHLYGLSCNQAVSEVFAETLVLLSYFFDQINSAPRDKKELDDHTLPSINEEDFANAYMTADASNINHQRPRNPSGMKHSYSDYYGGNCAKFEMVSGPDSLPLWVSLCFGGRGSERNIMEYQDCGLSFTDFWSEFQTMLEGAIGVEAAKDLTVKVLADKGTRIGPLVRRLGGNYVVPASLKDGFVSLSEAEMNERIAQARVHVERCIGRVKGFKILTGKLHARLCHKIDEILWACTWASMYHDYDDTVKQNRSEL